MIIQNFDLNLIPDSAPVVVHCDQYDRGTGRLVISLYEGSVAYSPSGTAVIQGVKPDGKGFDYNCTLSGNTVTADLTEQMTAVAGQVRTQIVVTESTGRTGTFVFILDVQRSALPADTDMSESDYQLIEQAIEDAQDAVEDSEAWAVGERGGVPVPSGDETYNNNAKYWAEQAAQYAQGGIIFKGSVAFASIPTTGMSDGDMYNITDDFTTDSRFIEGAGKECAAGTNIVWIEDVEKWDIFAMSKIGSLDDLNDVTLSSPTNGQVLKYNSTTQKWENANESGGGGGDYVGLYGDTLVGSDLNNITSVGNYYNDGTVTVSHYPSNAIITATSSFRLTVEKMGDSASTNLRQTYVLDNSVDFVFERHRTNGSWSSWQKVLTSYSNIGELDNVNISSPTNNQVLTYNSTTQKWENANAQGGSGDYVGLYGMTEIQSSDGQGTTRVDLNDYTTIGNYFCDGKAEVYLMEYGYVGSSQTLGGAKSNAVFLLYVRKISDTMLRQDLYLKSGTSDTRHYHRHATLINSAWSFEYAWHYELETGYKQTSNPGISLRFGSVNDVHINAQDIADNDILVFNSSYYRWENKPMSGYISNPNLLDNPWFTINQRGQSSYSSSNTYTVDRWKNIQTTTATVAVTDDGITITHDNSSNEVGFVQRMEGDCFAKLVGKTITLSVMLLDGTIKSGSVTVPSSIVTTPTTILTFDIDGIWNAYIYGRVTSQGANIGFRSTTANSVLSLKAVKLEVGSVSTLAMDTAPNYATELLKCQRYFIRLKTPYNYFVYAVGYVQAAKSIRMNLYLPTAMRTNPSLTKYGSFRFLYGNEQNDALDNATFALNGMSNNILFVAFTSSSNYSASVGTAGQIQVNNDANAYIDFTADL